MTIANFTRNLGRILSDNSPAILTYLGAAGVVSTVILAVRATPDAYHDVEIAHHNKNFEEDGYPYNLTPLEIVQVSWRHYIPTGIMAGITIACIFSAHKSHIRRNAALIGAYSLAEKGLVEYRDKVVELLGEGKDRKIRDEIAKDHILENPPLSTQVIVTDNGEMLCYDSLTGRYFTSDMETIRKAQNDVNAQCINEMYASQNDFYRLIGLPIVALGDEVGWRPDNQLDISFSSVLSENGKPCLSLEYRLHPIRGYWRIHE